MEKKKTNYSNQGRLNRAAGRRFELKVRKDLESQGYVVDKWTNNVDLEKGELIKVKNLFRGKNIPMMLGAGFPDFVGIKNAGDGKTHCFDVIGIEVKMKGYLDNQEKEKCKFYLDKGIFSKILIAKTIKNGRNINIEYIDFKVKYG